MTLAPAPAIPLDKVEWRVDGKPNQEGTKARFVAYFDARDAMVLLDEWVGQENWSDSYRETTIDGKAAVFCTLSIRVGDEWVSRTDVGVPSQFEPQLGAVSHAFKRAVVKWGVGRNVYELPGLWAPCNTRTANGKTQAYPNDKSLPDIHRQLKRLGFDAAGRVGGDASDTSETSSATATPERENAGGSSQIDRATGGGAPDSQSPPDACPGCGENARDGKPVTKVDGVFWHTEHAPTGPALAKAALAK